MAKKKNREDYTSYTINEPTIKAKAVIDYLVTGMQVSQVAPKEIMPVLGETVIRFLITVADICGYDKKDIVKSFGEGIMNAQIEFNEEQS